MRGPGLALEVLAEAQRLVLVRRRKPHPVDTRRAAAQPPDACLRGGASVVVPAPDVEPQQALQALGRARASKILRGRSHQLELKRRGHRSVVGTTRCPMEGIMA